MGFLTRNRARIAACASIVMQAAGCSQKSVDDSVVLSVANGVNCKVDYSVLDTSNLNGITINDEGINQKEKIRHLNELNSMPKIFLDVMRAKNLSINLTAGSITEFQKFSALKGQTPRGWPAGSTWDNIPGTGDETGVYLGDSSLKQDAKSLAIHETSHAVDASINFTTTNQSFVDLFNKFKAQPNPADNNASYRWVGHGEEAFAMGLEEYHCNDTTRTSLASWYPEFYQYIAGTVYNELQAQLNGTAISVSDSGSQGGKSGNAAADGYPYCTNGSNNGDGWGWDTAVTDPNGTHACHAASGISSGASSGSVGGYSCDQQKAWGKCSEAWMHPVCDSVCGGSAQASGGSAQASGGASSSGSVGGYSCDQQKAWGKCSETWMHPVCDSACNGGGSSSGSGSSGDGFPNCTNGSNNGDGWGWDTSVTDPTGTHSCHAA